MGEKCSKCGNSIHDNTRDCPGCGHRVYEERLENQLAIAESALMGQQELSDRRV